MVSNKFLTSMNNNDNERGEANFVLLTIGGIILIIVLIFAVIFGLWGASKAFGRYQARADANNRVKVSAIEIRNQAQRVLITQQQAEIRRVAAVGVREAQDEIAKTLTPLYVQFEMVEALKSIAASGSNNSVVFIPAGANGIPLITDATGPRVGGIQP